MSYKSEMELENNLIDKLKTMKYEYADIKTYEEMLTNFRVQLNRLNKNVLNEENITDKEFERIMIHLNNNTVFESAKILRDKFILERENEEQVYLRLLSQNEDENIYQVANQIKKDDGKYKNRYDVTILINGLPLIQIELKRSGIEINEAINQIDRYRLNSFTGLFKFINVFIVSNSNETRYFANTDNKTVLKALTFYWTDEGNNRINNLDEFCLQFLNHFRLNRLLNKYIVVSEANKAIMVMRPYQIYATELFVNKAKDTSKNGFVSHCTGSGKTLTSWKLSQLLISEPSIDKVFFLIDRNDLDTKTIDDFNSFEKDCVDMTDNTKTLVANIKNKHKKLIVTTIQKMSNAINREYYKSIIEPYRDSKVVFIIDECHRSQFGKMHADIQRFFSKAQYFGFTGTPIFVENSNKNERTTENLFEKCLHQYMMINAIHDQNVLGFNVEYISTYKNNKEYSREELKDIYESDEHISLVANHIYNHHKQKTINRKYTSIFATSSIEMLNRYYNKFKEINKDNELKIGAIYSFQQNEELEGKEEDSRRQLDNIIKDYNKMNETDFSTDTFGSYSKDIAKRLKKESSQPFLDILIVVDMYLTGFDSKPLNTLYVDKNLKYHGLVQAFSRTNRVFEKDKKFGNVVCFRNLKEQADTALKLFNGGQDVDINSIYAKKYADYLQNFNDNVDNLRKLTPKVDDIDNLMQEPLIKRFVYAFRDLINTVSVLETFSEFTWENEEIDTKITHQEYEDFKGRYRQLHEEIKEKKIVDGLNEESESYGADLTDIDFQLELIQQDMINVAYIMNLIKNINFENEKQKEKDIEFILKELKRADNSELLRKNTLIHRFMEEVVKNLKPNEVYKIDELYIEFETKEREKEIKSFCDNKNLEKELLKNIISEYEFANVLEKSKIRDMLKPYNLGYLEKRRTLNEIADFIEENVRKYNM